MGACPEFPPLCAANAVPVALRHTSCEGHHRGCGHKLSRHRPHRDSRAWRHSSCETAPLSDAWPLHRHRARPEYEIETGDGMMHTRNSAAAAPESPRPDALLVERIAALSDKTALAELDARHGMTLYAIAYSLLFDPAEADAAVAAAFREAWRWASSFDPCRKTLRHWLTDFPRRPALGCALLPSPQPSPRSRLA